MNLTSFYRNISSKKIKYCDIINVSRAAAILSGGDESRIANVRYFVEKCNQVLGTAFIVPSSERVINVEWLLRAIDVVYPVVHVQGRDLKEPYDYHTQLLAPNLHSSGSKRKSIFNLASGMPYFRLSGANGPESVW
jgi:hypothetical protein